VEHCTPDEYTVFFSCAIHALLFLIMYEYVVCIVGRDDQQRRF